MKTRAVLLMIAARLSEPSTWQGIGFICALFGAKFGVGLDWGQAAGLGGTLSAIIKMVVPDPAKVEVTANTVTTSTTIIAPADPS